MKVRPEDFIYGSFDILVVLLLLHLVEVREGRNGA